MTRQSNSSGIRIDTWQPPGYMARAICTREGCDWRGPARSGRTLAEAMDRAGHDARLHVTSAQHQAS